MPKPKLTTSFLITVEHEKPIPELTDLVAGRAYTLDGVSDVIATQVGAENAWRDAVINGLIVGHIYRREHDGDARKALSDLMSWENEVALDPAVSERAQALIDLGRATPLRTRVGDWLRGFWPKKQKDPTDWLV